MIDSTVTLTCGECGDEVVYYEEDLVKLYSTTGDFVIVWALKELPDGWSLVEEIGTLLCAVCTEEAKEKGGQ